MLIKYLVILSVLWCFNLKHLCSQPKWVNKVPEGFVNEFFVGRGISKISKAEAVQFALEDAIGSIIKNGKVTVQIAEKFDESSSEEFTNNNSVSLNVISKIARELNIHGNSTTISNLKEVETYTEENGNYFDAYVLVSVPKAKPVSPPGAFSPVWRSLLLPGWGQLYKDQTFKGLSFMALTLSGLAGGVIFRQLKEDANNKAFSSRTQARRDFYNDEAKNFNTYSWISFISAGVVYSWNIVDAVIIKQDNLYVNFRKQGAEVSISCRISF